MMRRTETATAGTCLANTDDYAFLRASKRRIAEDIMSQATYTFRNDRWPRPKSTVDNPDERFDAPFVVKKQGGIYNSKRNGMRDR